MWDLIVVALILLGAWIYSSNRGHNGRSPQPTPPESNEIQRNTSPARHNPDFGIEVTKDFKEILAQQYKINQELNVQIDAQKQVIDHYETGRQHMSQTIAQLKQDLEDMRSAQENTNRPPVSLNVFQVAAPLPPREDMSEYHHEDDNLSKRQDLIDFNDNIEENLNVSVKNQVENINVDECDIKDQRKEDIIHKLNSNFDARNYIIQELTKELENKKNLDENSIRAKGFKTIDDLVENMDRNAQLLQNLKNDLNEISGLESFDTIANLLQLVGQLKDTLANDIEVGNSLKEEFSKNSKEHSKEDMAENTENESNNNVDEYLKSLQLEVLEKAQLIEGLKAKLEDYANQTQDLEAKNSLLEVAIEEMKLEKGMENDTSTKVDTKELHELEVYEKNQVIEDLKSALEEQSEYVRILSNEKDKIENEYHTMEEQLKQLLDLQTTIKEYEKHTEELKSQIKELKDAATIQESLKSDNDESNEKIQKMKLDAEERIQEIEYFKHMIDDLKDKITELETIKQTQENTIGVLESESKRNEGMVEDERKRGEANAQIIHELNNVIDEKSQIIADLKCNQEKLEQTIEELQILCESPHVMEELNEQIENLKARCAQQDDYIKTLNQSLKVDDFEGIQTEEEFLKLKIANDENEHRIQDLEMKLHHKDGVIHNLEDKIIELVESKSKERNKHEVDSAALNVDELGNKDDTEKIIQSLNERLELLEKEKNVELSEKQDYINKLEEDLRFLQAGNESLKSELKDYSLMIQDLEAEKENQLGNKDDTEKIIQSLNERLELLEKEKNVELSEKQDYINKLEEDLRFLQAGNESLKSELKDYSLMIQDLEAEKENQIRINEELKEEVAIHAKIVQELQNDLVNLTQGKFKNLEDPSTVVTGVEHNDPSTVATVVENNELPTTDAVDNSTENTIEELTEKKNSLESEILKLENEMKNLLDNLQVQDNIIGELRGNVIEKDQIISEFREQFSTLQDLKEKFEERNETAQQTGEKLRSQALKVEELQNIIKKLENEVEAQSETVDNSTENTIEELTEKKNSLESEILKLENEMKNLLDNLQVQDNIIGELRGNIIEKDQIISEFREQFLTLQDLKEKFEERNETAQQTGEKLRSQALKVEELQNIIKKLENEVEAQSETIEVMTEEKNQNLDIVDELTKDLNVHKNKIAEMQDEMKKQSEIVEDFREQLTNAKILDSQTELLEMEEEMKKQMKIIEELMDLREIQVHHIEELNKELENIKIAASGNLDKHEEKIKQIEKQLDGLKEENKTLKEREAEFVKYLDRIQVEKEALNNQLTELQTELEKVTQALQEERREKEEREERIQRRLSLKKQQLEEIKRRSVGSDDLSSPINDTVFHAVPTRTDDTQSSSLVDSNQVSEAIQNTNISSDADTLPGSDAVDAPVTTELEVCEDFTPLNIQPVEVKQEAPHENGASEVSIPEPVDKPSEDPLITEVPKPKRREMFQESILAEGWVFVPDVNEFGQISWRKQYLVVSSRTIVFHETESDKYTKNYTHLINLNKVLHVGPLTESDPASRDYKDARNIFKIAYTEESIKQSSEILIEHDFYPVTYKQPTDCTVCPIQLGHLFKNIPALECRRCYIKIHKHHTAEELPSCIASQSVIECLVLTNNVESLKNWVQQIEHKLKKLSRSNITKSLDDVRRSSKSPDGSGVLKIHQSVDDVRENQNKTERVHKTETVPEIQNKKDTVPKTEPIHSLTSPSNQFSKVYRSGDLKKHLENNAKLTEPINSPERERAPEWVDSEFDKHPKYSLSELQKSLESLPKGIDIMRRELHLERTEFEHVFGMPWETFSMLPTWKQQYHKKRVGLF